jgi:hypothetical protein
VKPVSQQTRDAAIWALDVCADDRVVGQRTCTWHVLPMSSKAGRVAHEAFAAARLVLAPTWSVSSWTLTSRDTHATYLEAAALLRDGWNPGDPVEVRK